MGLEFGFVLADQSEKSVGGFVDRRIHIVGARLDFDVEVAKVHQNRARLFEFLCIQSDDDIDDVIGDPVYFIEFFKDVIPNGVGDLKMFCDDRNIVGLSLEFINFAHDTPLVNFHTLPISSPFVYTYRMEEKSHGILLSAIPYLGQQKILKVFTVEAGMISLIAKGNKLPSLCSPFCIAEWVYKKSEREIFPLTDGTLTDPLSRLRDSYEALSAAGSIAGDLLRSQFPSKPSPLLYELMAAYFRKIGTSAHPQNLSASFRLKLLLHDGILSLMPFCAHCGEPALSLSHGESYCSQHGADGHRFSIQEWETLMELAYSRQFSVLENAALNELLGGKINKVFEERTERDSNP